MARSDDTPSAFDRFMRRLGVPQGMEALVMTFGFVGIFLLGLGAYWIGERVRVARGGFSDDDQIVEGWEAMSALGLDVNKDGTEDVIGLYAGKAGIYLGAFDGKTTKLNWRAGPFNVFRTASGGLSLYGLQDGRIGVLEKDGAVRIFDALTGKEDGQVLVASGREVCGLDGDGKLVVSTSRADISFALDLATKTQTALPPERRPCGRGVSSARSVPATGLLVEGTVRASIQQGQQRVVLTVDKPQGDWLHGFTGDKPEPSWTFSVPAVPPGSAMIPANGASLDLADGRVYLGYWLKAGTQLVIALDASTGKKLWQTPLSVASSSFVHSLSATKQHVHVVAGHELSVFDAKTGKLLYQFG